MVNTTEEIEKTWGKYPDELKKYARVGLSIKKEVNSEMWENLKSCCTKFPHSQFFEPEFVWLVRVGHMTLMCQFKKEGHSEKTLSQMELRVGCKLMLESLTTF